MLIPLSLRREMNRISQRNSEGPGLIPLLLFLPIAATMMFMRSLWPNVFVLAVALLLALPYRKSPSL